MQTNLYWEVLIRGRQENMDQNLQPAITKEDFLQVSNLLNVYIVQDIVFVNFFSRIAPEVYHSKPSVFIRACVRHR